MLTRPDLEAAKWLAWFREAESEFEAACEHQAGLWLAEHQMSEGYLEAVERTKRARSRWEARLIALNAYMRSIGGG